jgi:hypothetical protein
MTIDMMSFQEFILVRMILKCVSCGKNFPGIARDAAYAVSHKNSRDAVCGFRSAHDERPAGFPSCA